MRSACFTILFGGISMPIKNFKSVGFKKIEFSIW